MTLQQRLSEAMKEAMRARDAERLSALRMLLAALKNREIEARRPLDEGEALALLSTLAKQRREAAEAYREGGRPELADKEERELAILQEFLPRPLADAELAAMIDEAVRESGATSPREMGQVMKLLAPRTQGRADNRKVSELVRARLA